MPDNELILKGSQLVKSFPEKARQERLTVLNDISIDIHRGEIISVVGASGSGKSTLLHILGGLDHPDSGTVLWNNQSLYDLTSDELADFRNNNLGFVFQFHHLLPEFTALENVMMPSLIGEISYNEAQKMVPICWNGSESRNARTTVPRNFPAANSSVLAWHGHSSITLI